MHLNNAILKMISILLHCHWSLEKVATGVKVVGLFQLMQGLHIRSSRWADLSSDWYGDDCVFACTAHMILSSFHW